MNEAPFEEIEANDKNRSSDKKIIFRNKRILFALLIPLSLLLTSLAHKNPGAVEKYFSRGAYKIFAESYGRLFGYLPFSVSQFLILIAPIALLVYLICGVLKFFRDKNERTGNALRVLANLACAAGVLFFMYTAFCGLNYARQSFAQTAGLDVRPSSSAELAALCAELATNLSESALAAERNESGVTVLSRGGVSFLQAARDAYDSISNEYPFLGGFTPFAKPVLYSRALSHLDIVGVYSPFTMEANFNSDVPDYLKPAAAAHELAHFKGFMREDEANFIAWLVCRASGDADFIYSGDMLALVHATNQLRAAGPEDYNRIMSTLPDGVFADFAANREYWKRFEGKPAEISNSVNDAYLKSNRQADGVRSYGRMVDLLLADYRKRHGE